MTDAERLERAYTSAILQISRLVGNDQLEWAAKVDTDRVPAATLNAGRHAVEFLTVGLGLLDLNGPSVETDADQFLTRLMAGEDAR